MKLKDKDGKEYTGEINGGVFAVWDANKKNVGNFKSTEEAVKLGGFTVIAEAASPQGEETPKTDAPKEGEQGKTDTPPKTDAPKTEEPKKKETAAA